MKMILRNVEEANARQQRVKVEEFIWKTTLLVKIYEQCWQNDKRQKSILGNTVSLTFEKLPIECSMYCGAGAVL